MNKNINASALNGDAIDKLSNLIEETTRSTKESAKYFIEPAGNTLNRASSKRHHIIFGRRGSGKSSLLHKLLNDARAERSPIVYIDMESFKGHSYPDVLVSVLLSTFEEFIKWVDGVATEPGSRQSFWKKLIGRMPNRSPIRDERLVLIRAKISTTIKELNGILHSEEETERTREFEAATKANKH